MVSKTFDKVDCIIWLCKLFIEINILSFFYNNGFYTRQIL